MALGSPELFQQLCSLAESLGISVRQDAIEGSRGGLYILKGERHLLVNRDLPLDDKIDVMTETLKKEELDRVYVLPAVRAWLDAG